MWLMLFFLMLGMGEVRAADLTCGRSEDMWQVLPVTQEIGEHGSKAGVRLGFNQNYGGIGVKFELVNQSNGERVDIVEARSSAGAAWQFGRTLTDTTGKSYLIDQGVGNALNFQWGYSTSLEVNGNEVRAGDWIPNYANVADGRGVSPCVGDTTIFEEGKTQVGLRKKAVAGGEVVEVVNSYTVRGVKAAGWRLYIPGQGLYMSRKVARESDLRVYLVGEGWIEGPIRPYDDFRIDHANYVKPVPEWDAWQIWPETKKVILVWRVGGKDVGVLYDDVSYGSTLRLDKRPYCGDINNDVCGSIDYAVNRAFGLDVNYSAGLERRYSWRYVVGTVPQLEEWAGRGLTPDSAFGRGCRIQGWKMGVDGVEVVVNGGERRSKEDPYVMEGVVSGKKKVEIIEPKGYRTEYSYCEECTDHEEASWVVGKTAEVVCENGSYVDLWWRFNKILSTGDANGDGKINIADFAIWKIEYLSKNGLRSDFDNNGKTTVADFAIWKMEYLKLK